MTNDTSPNIVNAKAPLYNSMALRQSNKKV